MIITKEMFDEFVESAENHTILWTDTLAPIGVTVGDVPDVDVIEAQAAEIARLIGCLAKANTQAEHFEREWYLRGDRIEAQAAEIEKLREALEKIQAVDRHNRHRYRQSLATGDTHLEEWWELGESGKIARAALAQETQP